MFVQLWKSFLEELKTAKQMIIIPKCNGRLIRVEKNDINLAITESTKNVYHVTRQNLRFVHAPCNKKKLKMAAKEWTDDKTFRFRNDLLWAGPGGDYVLWGKAF